MRESETLGHPSCQSSAGLQVPQAGWPCRSLPGFPLNSPCSFLCVCFFFFLKQPHNILQKRLMETNLSKLRSGRGSWTLKSDISAQTNKLNQTKLGSSGKTEDEDLIVVSCQVIVLPQPSAFFFPQNFISDSVRLCSCSPCFPD